MPASHWDQHFICSRRLCQACRSHCYLSKSPLPQSLTLRNFTRSQVTHTQLLLWVRLSNYSLLWVYLSHSLLLHWVRLSHTSFCVLRFCSCRATASAHRTGCAVGSTRGNHSNFLWERYVSHWLRICSSLQWQHITSSVMPPTRPSIHSHARTPSLISSLISYLLLFIFHLSHRHS